MEKCYFHFHIHMHSPFRQTFFFEGLELQALSSSGDPCQPRAVRWEACWLSDALTKPLYTENRLT